VEWLKDHFAKTHLRNLVPLALLHILVLELISGILCIVGCIELLINNGRLFGFTEPFFLYNLTYVTFGQRLAKDYDGARTIVIFYTRSNGGLLVKLK
jgi:hypothetical protein